MDNKSSSEQCRSQQRLIYSNFVQPSAQTHTCKKLPTAPGMVPVWCKCLKVWVTGYYPVVLFPWFSQKAYSQYLVSTFYLWWLSCSYELAVIVSWFAWTIKYNQYKYFYRFFSTTPFLSVCSPPPCCVLRLNWKFSGVVFFLCRYISLPSKVNYLSVINGFKHHHSTQK